MMFPFFTIFLLFLAWLTYNRVRTEKKERAAQKAFWQKEEAANATRKKDLSSLPYIILPLDSLPLGVRPEDELLSAYDADIQSFTDRKILNLAGQSNTDLKLAYGAPNLTFLTQCDQNFTELIRLMQEWASRLYELSLTAEAEQVLSCTIRWGSDIKGSYLLLARIYQESGRRQELEWLKEQASHLNTLMKEPILSALAQF